MDANFTDYLQADPKTLSGKQVPAFIEHMLGKIDEQIKK
jgi:hypothetical protein